MEEPSFRRIAATQRSRWTGASATGSALLALALATFGSAASPSVPEAAASGCPGGDTKPAKLSANEARKAIICLVNRRRDNAGIGSLARDRRLQKAAQRHNKRMHGNGCFAHQCPGEGGLDTRLRSVGYLSDGLRHWSYAENIAWGRKGRGTPASIVDAWMHSSGHRANILSRDFRDLGVGFAAGTPSKRGASGGIFTVEFGLRVG
jgi:uncharacterized protein YkwD